MSAKSLQANLYQCIEAGHSIRICLFARILAGMFPSPVEAHGFPPRSISRVLRFSSLSGFWKLDDAGLDATHA